MLNLWGVIFFQGDCSSGRQMFLRLTAIYGKNLEGPPVVSSQSDGPGAGVGEWVCIFNVANLFAVES